MILREVYQLGELEMLSPWFDNSDLETSRSKAAQLILIVALPRSGSNFLCRQLWELGYGRPKSMKAQNKKTVLTCLLDSILWKAFRSFLSKGYSQGSKSMSGRKKIDHLILFKMLVLQQLFNLGDEKIEFQVNDR